MTFDAFARLQGSPDRVLVVSASLAAAKPFDLETSPLSADEQARATRFAFQVHRERFAAARGLLRELLGRLLEVAPKAVRFESGAGGKPRLPPDLGRGVRFNLSHSQDRGLFSFSRGRELGVDIEALRGAVEHTAIAMRFFSPAERAALASLASSERAAAFFTVWTRKEAYIKLLGRGLSIPLDSFDVSLDEPARLLRPSPDAPTDHVELQSLEVPAGFRAALAYDGGPAEVEFLELA